MAKKKQSGNRSAAWVVGLLVVLFAAAFILYEFLQNDQFVNLPDWFSSEKNLTKESLELEEAINEALAKCGISDANLVAISTTEKRQAKKHWYYFEKQVKLPQDLDIQKVQTTLTNAVQQTKGNVIKNLLKNKEGEKILLFQAGINNVTTHSLAIGQLLSAVNQPAKARIALIIDDLGNNQDIRLLDEVKLPLTVAVLPQLTYSSYSVAYALKKKLVPILHLPLEPADSTKKPGPGVITTSMSKAEIISTLEKNLASVDGVIGVNSHMGSLATRNRRVMGVVLREIKKRGLFYVDSMVVNDSIGPKIAAEIDLVHFTRDVFIDNLDEVTYVKGQLEELIQTALENGRAIGIGHIYHESTRTALKEMTPVFAAKGVAIVPITAFLPAEGAQFADLGL